MYKCCFAQFSCKLNFPFCNQEQVESTLHVCRKKTDPNSESKAVALNILEIWEKYTEKSGSQKIYIGAVYVSEPKL